MLRPRWKLCDEQWKLDGVYVDASTQVFLSSPAIDNHHSCVQPKATKNSLPAGWMEVIHEAKARKYSTFFGPFGKRERSLSEVQHIHAAQQAGQTEISTLVTSHYLAYCNLGEDGVVATNTCDRAGIVGTTVR